MGAGLRAAHMKFCSLENARTRKLKQFRGNRIAADFEFILFIQNWIYFSMDGAAGFQNSWEEAVSVFVLFS
jgi:hypothetical protein